MKYITFIRFISILFYTSTIFIFIRKYEDYIYVPLLQALGSIISSLLACYLLVQAEGVRWVWPRYKRVKFYFIDAIPFFFSRFSVVFNGGIARLMSGLFLSMHMVAAFDLAQKVATFALTPMQMSNQAAYPHIAKTKSKIFVKRFLSMNVLLSFVVSVSVFVLAPFITWYFAGDTLPEAVGIIRILCLYIFFAGMTTFLGAPVLVSFGISKGFNNSVIISSLLLAFLYALGYITNIFTIYHFAFAQCFAEFVILLIRGWYARKYHII